MEWEIDLFITYSYGLLRGYYTEKNEKFLVLCYLKQIKEFKEKYKNNKQAIGYFQQQKNARVMDWTNPDSLECLRRVELVEKNEKEN